MYTLKFPFKDLTDTEIKALKFRNDGRIKVGDLLRIAEQMDEAKAAPSSENAYLVARMCGLSLKEIEEMDVSDFNEVVRLLQGKGRAS